MLRVDDQHRLHVGQQFVMDLKRVRRHFQHHGVAQRQMLLDPRGQVGVGNTLRTEHHLLRTVHTHRNEVVLVNVKPDEARWRCTNWRHTASLW